MANRKTNIETLVAITMFRMPLTEAKRQTPRWTPKMKKKTAAMLQKKPV